jgi:tRNA modification GTPase
LLDEALVLRFDAPASATGEDLVELHCHGGRAVVDAVLAGLAAIDGLRLAAPGEFTRRAFENGRIDLTEAEGLADLLEAETQSQRKAALALTEGGLRKQVEQWQARLLGLSAEAERAIDYAEEDDDPTVRTVNRECAAFAKDLEQWLKLPRSERLKDGLRVVVAGPTNAGKSSLVNAIAGSERAIVTEVPGTTRDYLEVPLAVGGVPMVLTDTAGIRQTDDLVEALGVERAGALAANADILLWMGDAAEAPQHERLIYVHGKADLPGPSEPPADAIAVSSANGSGLSELLERVQTVARAMLPSEGAVALNRRQAQLIEEAAAALRGIETNTDVVLVAENLRAARAAFDRLTGRAGVEDLLDALFGRFCLGK